MSKNFAFLIVVLCIFGSPFAQSATVDGEPSQNGDGLYVWRTTSGDWSARLVSNNQSQSFSGNFETDGSYNNYSGFSLERSDRVTRASGVMEMELKTWPGGSDGVDFGVSSGASLCLLDTGSNGTRIFLGRNAVAASAPVDLTGDGACGSNPPGGDNGDGLYVTQTSGSTWEATLASTDAPQLFAGTFEATGNISSVQRISLESHDTAELTSPDVLSVELQTWPGGTDAVRFSIGSGGACLRDFSGSSSTVYLGTPGDAISASTPVDLTGSGACDGGASPPPTPPPSGRRYTVGHYVRLMKYNDTERGMNQADEPGVVGVMKMYPWRELEPSQGNYDFSEIASDLQTLAGKGLQLVVMIEDKTFKNEEPLPPYLSTNQYRRPARQGGYTAIRWSPFVINRLNALTTALGNRFNANPNFEGVAFQESAPSLDDVHLNQTGYTPEKYRDALIEILRHSGNAMPNARVFWFMNFLPQRMAYMGDVLEATKNYGVVAGGPDVAPDDYSLTTHTYPILRSYIGEMPMFTQVEGMVYSHEHADPSYPTKYWTMPELFRYARDNLKVNYMFWVLFPNASPPDSYDFYDALPVIRNNPTFN